ncbi:hypothetical protein [Variovorax sp. Sphag1AA]|uniref:hypothetical protein n=1 Tax=Variovorax sp. Sphag1AA TaxID=2587027 RepID=UPI0016104A9C|nr:hypothetical protein [Variovorax sp. Sphag1AA]MBB3176368.1 hypothetical protein [Variovorax sp. Sphag1AA]
MTSSQLLLRVAARTDRWPPQSAPAPRYELQFPQLPYPCHNYAVPCDDKGRIELFQLNEERSVHLRPRTIDWRSRVLHVGDPSSAALRRHGHHRLRGIA